MQQSWSRPQPFELVDHTADVGVRVEGSTLEETLARLVLAQAQLLSGGAQADGEQPLCLEVPASRLELVGVDLLRELNRIFYSRKLIVSRVDKVELGEGTVCVQLTCGRYDPIQHAEGMEIKAVTYHAACLAPSPAGGYVAQVLFDI